MYTWAQLGLHTKPIALLDVDGYYQPLLGLLDHMTEQGFLRPEYREMLIVDPDPSGVLDRYPKHRAPREKWSSEHVE